MKKLRLVGLTGLSVTLAVLSAGVASALWGSAGSVTPPALMKGVVSFAAQVRGDPNPLYATAAGPGSTAGTPVNVTLPGAVIAQTLDGKPVVWRFDVRGFAQGIAGLTYDLEYSLPEDNTPFVIDTVIEGTSLIVYPAMSNGDCTAVPADPPEPVDGVVSIPGQVLQPPGANPTSQELVQTWCVWLDWRADPPQYHTNVALATATASDNTTVTATSVFESYIDFKPTLDPMGGHVDIASVEGTAEDGTIARDNDTWGAVLYPDPNREPDLVFTLTPHVTFVTPAGGGA